MAPPGVTLIKKFQYRQAPEEWSNTYHFLGDAPSTDVDWQDLIDALVALEVQVLTIRNYVVRAYGYADTDNDASFVYDIAGTGDGVRGTVTPSDEGAVEAPGDCAGWIRWKTNYLNSKGKPVYLRKYYHGIYLTPETGDNDLIETACKAALDAGVGLLRDASTGWPGMADPHHNAPGVGKSSTYITTRTLKRRGKRPS